MANLDVKNRKLAKALIAEQQSPIEFCENNETHKISFRCGAIKGYVSPAVRAKINTVGVNDLQFAECRKPDTDVWVPCLMMVGSTKTTVKRTLTA